MLREKYFHSNTPKVSKCFNLPNTRKTTNTGRRMNLHLNVNALMQKEGDTIGGIPSVKQPAKPHMLLFREPCCRFYSLPRTVSGKTTTDMLMILRSVEETGAAGARLSGCLETMAVGL